MRFGKEREELMTKEWSFVSVPKATVNVPTEGKFLFEVQALDAAGTVLAIAKLRQINILPPPVLAAPEFVDFDTKLKKANADGSIKIRWKEIEDASGYIIFLKDSDRKGEDKKFEENSTSLQLTGLNPGKYKIQISTVNERGEQGKFGEVNYIEVPKTSDIAAPKIKTIKVH
jgi:hypothetical protein